MRIEILGSGIETAAADALLLPVDGQICRLGGAAAKGLRLALPPDERATEIDFVEDALEALRPVPHPQARVIEGVAIWPWILVSAAYPHNVNDRIFSPAECAEMLRRALPRAIALAEERGIRSIAATLIGVAYRMPEALAARAFVDGVAAASRCDILVRWSLPKAEHRVLGHEAARRVGLIRQ